MTLIKNDFESNLPGRNIMYFLKKTHRGDLLHIQHLINKGDYK